MEVITIESETFKKLIKSLEELKTVVSENFNHSSNPGNLNNKTWLNKKEACQKLRVSERTLQTYRNTGIIPFSRIQGKIYYKAEDLQAFFNDHYQKGNSH
ncbi:MAG: helix-turn-helix domain-containing protein [Bacteroidetes bacterium]|nr:helix-turn-helix domain-containing protein [Bacteroidota bacterium]